MSAPFIVSQKVVSLDSMKPVSYDLEQALIGSVLRGGRDTFERVREIVTPEQFYSQSHRSIWQALGNIFDNGLQIDTIVVGDEMERLQAIGELEQEWGNGVWSGRAYLAHLRSEGDPRNAETYAEQVQDYHVKRFLLEFSGKMAGWSANGRRAKDIMADVESEFSKLVLYGTQDEYTAGIEVGLSETYDWTDRAARGEIVGTPTGLIDLDHILGTLINGNVYYLAGRPGTGKTALCLSIARNAAKKLKKRVGIFSLEMSRLQVTQRLVAQEVSIDLEHIIHGTLQDHEWALFTHGIEEVGTWNIIINDLSDINIAQIRQTARRIKARGGLDLLVIDYIQLAAGEPKKYERRDLEVTAISRGLKALARELNVPVLAAAQLSRAVEQRQSKRPILSDLRESGSLEQDGYAVIFLYKSDEESNQNIINIDVAKHRNGRVGDCQLLFNSPYTRFDNLYNRLPSGDTAAEAGEVE